MQLEQRREEFGNEDQSWLGSAHGTDSTDNATLVPALFTAGTHYPMGYIPSGTLLGKVTSVGATQNCYGPYDPAANDGRQTFVGALFTSQAVRGTVTSTTRVVGSILKHGAIKVARLPIPSQVDNAARTAAAGRIIFE